MSLDNSDDHGVRAQQAELKAIVNSTRLDIITDSAVAVA
jgi:hypothetical protein